MTTLIVIPCSGAKATERRTAEAMYLGSLHRAARAAAERRLVDLWSHGIDARIVTLSAKHGLLEDGDVIEPYDQELDKPGQVTPDRKSVV